MCTVRHVQCLSAVFIHLQCSRNSGTDKNDEGLNLGGQCKLRGGQAMAREGQQRVGEVDETHGMDHIDQVVARKVLWMARETQALDGETQRRTHRLARETQYVTRETQGMARETLRGARETGRVARNRNTVCEDTFRAYRCRQCPVHCAVQCKSSSAPCSAV